MEIDVREMCEILEAESPRGVQLRRKVRICTDSRRITKGDVYWALQGERFDGHEFVKESLEKGGLAAVVAKAWADSEQNMLRKLICIDDTNSGLLKLASSYAAKFRIPKISLTGSNGKTSTKDMIVAVLSDTGPVLGTRGNFNNHIGLPLTLFDLNSKHKYAVLELGTNHPGEISALSKVARPSVAVVTNIGDSHLENFGSRKAILKEKLSITDGFKNKGTLFVNVDDPLLSKVRPSARIKLSTYGIHKGKVRPENLEFDDRGRARFTLGRVRFQLAIPGLHMVYNALAAISVGLHFRIPKKNMSKALELVKPAPHRMDWVKVDDVEVLDDCYNASPASMKSALTVFGDSLCSGKKIAVLGDMLELGPQTGKMHQEVGQFAAEAGLDVLFTFGDLSRHINKGAREKGFRPSKCQHFSNFEILEKKLREELNPGDLLLLKGSRAMALERLLTGLQVKGAAA